MLARLYGNHVLANALFVLVLALGTASYVLLPRPQDPSINFNWIDITTILPGATARDVERRVTDPLERAIRNVRDVRFVSSTSRESVSSILVRFEDIDEDTFRERTADLRREIRSAEDELPDDADDPRVLEITTANAFPSATIVVTAPADGERLRHQAELIQQEIEQLTGVDSIIATGLTEPELQVILDPERLDAYAIAPDAVADTVRNYFRDLAAGDVQVGSQKWLVSVSGTSADPALLGRLPVATAAGEIPLDALATVQRGRSEPATLVRHEGRPGVMLAVNKTARANTLDLVERLAAYVEDRNRIETGSGVRLVMADDQTEITRKALDVMQTNLLIGLLLVLVVTWLFLGTGISLLTAIGIPAILAGTFCVLFAADHTLNVMVLLGIVIALGMLVDDAVVVVEAIYYRLERGEPVQTAVIGGLREVFAPVTSAVATTIAAFLPLMLLPGILGKFMFLVPMVVTTALAISLIEAYWFLPVHILSARVDLTRPSRHQRLRTRALWWIRNRYTRLLTRAMRWPKLMLISALALFLLAITAVATETGVRREFFASDPVRLFYVNVDMPIGTRLERTLEQTLAVERRIRAGLRDAELREIVAYAGRKFTETAPLRGDHYGQLIVSLRPKSGDLRGVDRLVDDLRPRVQGLAGPDNVTFLKLAGGPPTTKPISLKMRGSDFERIRAAAEELKGVMATNEAITDITDDDTLGQMTLALRVDATAAHRAGLSPAQVARAVKLMVDGEIVSAFQDRGEEREVRVAGPRRDLAAVDDVLAVSLPTPAGGSVPLAELVEVERRPDLASIRHYNFRRTITVEADIDRERTDTVAANEWILGRWEGMRERHPEIDIDSSGLLDDITESIDSMAVLFLLGVGLMYLILGTQFHSYFQPFMILTTVPMAFTGVTAGLMVTANPVSLYTMYGLVALSGIAVNAAIVLVSAANTRLDAGMSVLHATLFAARRRVIPILITSTTTVAGLFSLATGLGGESLIWGPVATAIVWGLVVSTALTLFVVPTLYALTMRRSWRLRARNPDAA
ncbi:MAG: efflux RND transporter permease subunit [Halofilum sp. (in: g-proteobacteria)]|nr:efflux RND transporter permease subunit [Halofilum sp. (in: g-proteobacteria)]